MKVLISRFDLMTLAKLMIAGTLIIHYLLQISFYEEIKINVVLASVLIILITATKITSEYFLFKSESWISRIALGIVVIIIFVFSCYSTFSVRWWNYQQYLTNTEEYNNVIKQDKRTHQAKIEAVNEKIKGIEDQIAIKKQNILRTDDKYQTKRERYSKEVDRLYKVRSTLIEEKAKIKTFNNIKKEKKVSFSESLFLLFGEKAKIIEIIVYIVVALIIELVEVMASYILSRNNGFGGGGKGGHFHFDNFLIENTKRNETVQKEVEKGETNLYILNRADYLKNTRIKLDYTQKEFAKILSINRTSLSKMETGKQPISDKIIVAIKNIESANVRKRA